MIERLLRKGGCSLGRPLMAGALACGVAVSGSAVAPVRAQEAEPAEGECPLCVPSAGWELDTTFGPGYVTDDAYKFGDYTGLGEKGGYLFGDVFARWRGKNGGYSRLEGYRLGQDSRALFFEGGKQSRYELRAFYQEIPRRIYDTTQTPFLGVGTDDLTLPPGWVRGGTTQGMTALDASLQPVKIEEDWKVAGAGFTIRPATRWAFDVDYRRQEREGQGSQGGSFFFNASQLIRPIDYSTDQLDAKVGYAAHRWQLNLTYAGSVFKNENESLTWQNPYTPLPGAGTQDEGELAQPPDNQAHYIGLNGSVQLPARTLLSGQLSVGRQTQNEDLLPYTVNPAIAVNPLPRDTADAEVETTNANLRIVSSPARLFSIEGELDYYDRDNKTDMTDWDYVVTDWVPAGTPAENIAYDYTRTNANVRAELRANSRNRFHIGYDYQRYKRPQQEREETDTRRWWFKYNARPVRVADINIELYSESRDGSEYETITDVPVPQNPAMRLYNMADRERDGLRANISFTPTDRANIAVEYEYNDDDYNNSVLGLLTSNYQRYGLDLSLLLTERITGYIGLYNEEIDSEQADQNGANPIWNGFTNDQYWTGTVGLRIPRLTRRWGMNLEYTRAASKGEITIDNAGLQSQFPDLRSDLHQFKLGVDYAFSPAWSLQLGYWYEKFDTSDWALEGVEPDTVPNLLSLGADPFNYETSVIFLGARFLFDSRGRTARPSAIKPQTFP
jgi:MtrB/PioB family decaheme-associated outer membrane protein